MAPTVQPFHDDASKWAAVVARKPAADGIFVYCVRTTGIFCRPICKSRLARRSNVRFYTTTKEAEREGFRACKRCRPDLPSYNPEADVVKKVCKVIQSHPTGQLLKLEVLAKTAGLTKSHFHRLFKRETGLTPKEYQLQHSAERSKSEQNLPQQAESPFGTTSTGSTLLDEDQDFWSAITDHSSETTVDTSGDETMTDCDPHANMSGFGTEDIFLPETNITIDFSVVKTSHGPLLVAFKEDRQICRLELGETEDELLAHLAQAYPSWLYTCGRLKAGDDSRSNQFAKRVEAIVEALERPTGKMLDLQLDESLLSVWEPTS